MGILTDGQQISAQLTESECATLSSLLTLLRDRQQPRFLSTFLEHLGWHVKHNTKLELERVLHEAFEAAHQNTLDEDIKGTLFFLSEEMHIINEDEYRALSQYLKLQRSDSWLNAFFSTELSVFDAGRRRTPEQVIKSLVSNELDAFDTEKENARNMVAAYPQLFPEFMNLAAPVPAAPLTDKDRAELPGHIREHAKHMEGLARKVEKRATAKRGRKSAA